MDVFAVNCNVRKGQREATIRSQITLMLAVVAHASRMHGLVPLRRHHSHSSCPHPMLKSLKLGELGLKGIPLCFHLTGDQKCCEAVSAAWWT